MADSFSVNGVEEAWVLGFREKNIIYEVFRVMLKRWMVKIMSTWHL